MGTKIKTVVSAFNDALHAQMKKINKEKLPKTDKGIGEKYAQMEPLQVKDPSSLLQLVSVEYCRRGG